MESHSGGSVPASKYSSVKYYIPPESYGTPSQDGEHSGTEQAAGTETRPRTGVSSTQYIPKAGDRLNFQIPRKNKEKRALFQYVSSESREFEDILTILSSNYREASSNGMFMYTKPRLVHSELLEKDFVEKRRELKQDGRTEKELEETHCFLMADATKLPWICEKGLLVGHSWITALGNPAKGVYLSKNSDLLQINPFNPGVMGEIIIFKVIKGKVKSIYENMSKNLLDPTPKFDSHFSKNANKVTSLTSYRAYELTQQYFYEYDFDELKPRPRHVCPYAVVSFQFKGKDAPLQAKPMAPLRSNSQTSEGSTGRSKYTVWSGELVNEGRAVSQVSFCSFSPPFLPFKLPEKLELGLVMRIDQVNQMIPSALFSWNLYAGSHQVLKNGTYCSLLEVVEKSKSGDRLAALLQGLETQRLVLVHVLADKGFLFLLSSVQMAAPTERRDGWKRGLQALFVFQESRDVTKYSTNCPATQEPLQSSSSRDTVMPQLKSFVPALHHALVKVRCNPPADLSAGVEHQARDYLSGLHDGKLRHVPMTEYDTKLDDRGKLFPAPKHHKLNMEGYLRSYVYSPNLYTMPVVRAKEMMESYCVVPDDISPVTDWEGGSKASGCKPVVGSEVKPNGPTAAQPPAVQVNLSPFQSRTDSNPQKVKELINLILKCRKNAEGDVRKRGEAQGGAKEGAGPLDPRGLKRKLERETAERTLKYLKKASQERGRVDSRPAEGGQNPSCLSSLMLHSVGLRDVDLRRDGSEAAVKLLKMLTSLKNAAGQQPQGSEGRGGGSREGAEQTEALLFDRMIKLGLPPNQDIDLRKRPFGGLQDKADYLEEQAAGSMSSLEGFSPSSNGEMPRRSHSQCQGEEQIPWVLIPITGLKSKKYCQREKDNPQDPRFVPQIPMATSSYTRCVPERRERNVTPTLEETPEPSPSPPLEEPPEPSPSPPLEEPPELSPCPSPYPSPYSSPYPSPYPSPIEDDEQLAETPCDPTEITNNKKTTTDETNQSLLQVPFTPESTSFPEKSSNPSPEPGPAVEPTHTNPSPREAGQEQAEGSTGKYIPTVVAAEDPRTMEVEQEEEVKEVEEEEQVTEEVKEEEDKEQVTEEVKEEEDLMEVLDGVEEQLEEGELVEEENEHVEEEVKVEVETDLKQTEQVSPRPASPVPPIQNPPPIQCPPVQRPVLTGVESILDQQFSDFSTEMQILLLRESVHYSSSLLHAQNAPQQLPVHPLLHFSEYVSFYNSSPPMQAYVTSLRDRMGTIIDLQDQWIPGTLATHPALVSSITNRHHANHTPPTATYWNHSFCGPVSQSVPSHRLSPDPGLSLAVSQSVPSHRLSPDPDPGLSLAVSQSVPSHRLSPDPGLSLAVSQSVPSHRSPALFAPGPDSSNSYSSLPVPHFNSNNSTMIPSSSFPGTAYSHTLYNNPPQTQTGLPQLSSSLSPLPLQPLDSQWTTTAQNPDSDGRLGTCKPSDMSKANKWTTTTQNTDLDVRGLRTKCKPQTSVMFESKDDVIMVDQPVSAATVEAPPPCTQMIDSLSGVGGPVVEPVPGPGPASPSAISSLISQLKPELFSNLVEIIKDVQKNSVQFYIHTQERESEREVSHHIKEYLQRLGNVERSPVSFLERENRMDKLMVLIQNKDIAAHIHKIPALVRLKRQPSVIFAGVDSLDDVKNHTYNELFVSGGFVVSDEFVLNPDYITHDRLRVILMFLDQQNSSESLWRWRVHWKTQKKLKEQSRFKSEARKMLNLLTTYQKKNIVEFLPYHECDAPSRPAPDLDCLLKLQAQHIQQRHIIFLTESHFEMFPHYSSTGIVVANINDIMHNFGGLVGFHDIRDKRSTSVDLIAAATTVREEKRVLEEPILLDSPSSPDRLVDRLSTPLNEDDFRPPLPDQLVPDTGTSMELNFQALKEAISQFKADKAARSQMAPPEVDGERPESPPGPRIPGLGTDSPGGLGDSGVGFLTPGPGLLTPTPGFTPSPVSLLGPVPLRSSRSPAGIQKEVGLTPTRQAREATLSSLHSKLGLSLTGSAEVTSDMSLCGPQGRLNAFSSHRGPLAGIVTEGHGESGAKPSNTNDPSGPEHPMFQGENTKPSPVEGSLQGGGGMTDKAPSSSLPGPPGPRAAAPRPVGGGDYIAAATDRLAQAARQQQRNGLLPMPNTLFLNSNLNLHNHGMSIFQRPMLNRLEGPAGRGGIRPLMPNAIGWARMGQAGGSESCLWGLQQQNMGLGRHSFPPRLMGNPHHPWDSNQTANQGRGNGPWKR